MSKQCPICGKKYTKEHNFCSKHSELVKLVETKDYVKICPKCGKKYTEEHNFCSKHSEAIKLAHFDELVKICRVCGSKYPEYYNYCIRCKWDEPLEYINKKPEPKKEYINKKPEPKKIKIKIADINIKTNKRYNFNNHSNNYKEVPILLSAENIQLLKEFSIDESQFKNILKDICRTHEKILNDLIKDYDIDLKELSILDKMLLFSKSFVKTEFKEGGGDLGHFEFNEIYIDDRLETALQITTIIHELSHFLLAEILEQCVSFVLDTDKTDALEAFVCYTLVNDDFNYLVDEYCAHTVEGRFAILGYQDYGSYKDILKRFLLDYTHEHLDVANTIGNTFAWYIKLIMESFIDEDLRSDIKKEFLKLHDEKRYGELIYETNDYLKWDKFKQAIKLMLTRNIDELMSNSEDMKKLYLYSKKFKESNG